MNDKLEVTVGKTIEALARVERFIEKYGDLLEKEQLERVAQKLKDVQKTIDRRTD